MRTYCMRDTETLDEVSDGDTRLYCKAKGFLSDSDMYMVSDKGNFIHTVQQSAPWINPPWEYRMIVLEGEMVEDEN